MKTLTIGILAQYYGIVDIGIPDTINTDDEQALKDYVDSIWEGVPLPDEMEYVPCSDAPDWDGEWDIEQKENS